MLRRLAGCLPPAQRARLRDWVPPALLRRLRADGHVLGGGAQQAAAAGSGQAVARPFADILLVMEADGAEALVGDLFRRRFRTDSFPQRPRHFVGFYRGTDGALLPVGYVHHDTWNGNSLCGGLVIDERMYRRIPAVDRETIHAAGGVAEAMLRGSFALLEAGLAAIWAHVGDRQSEKVCHRVGYRRTDSEYVMVIWLRDDLSDAEKAERVRQIVAYGPF